MPVLLSGRGPYRAVLATGSPMTIVERSGDGSRSHRELRLQHGAAPEISRFVFPDLRVFDLTVPPAGVDTPVPLQAVVGVSLLRHFSALLVYRPTPTLTLSNRIPDHRDELSRECDPRERITAPAPTGPRCQGVFRASRIGGGHIQVGGDEIELSGSRLVLSLCVGAAPFRATQPTNHGAETVTGVPLTAVVATELGRSVMARSAFDRLRAAQPALSPSPGATVFLPSGDVPAETVDVAQVSVVANETNELGPCGELAFRRRLVVAEELGLSPDDRRLLEEEKAEGAAVATVTAPVPFAVVEDDTPLLQGLRLELEPYVANVDVVLGGGFWRHFDLTLDYPSGRIILSCGEATAGTTCRVIPWCDDAEGADPRCPGLES